MTIEGCQLLHSKHKADMGKRESERERKERDRERESFKRVPAALCAVSTHNWLVSKVIYYKANRLCRLCSSQEAPQQQQGECAGDWRTYPIAEQVVTGFGI